MQPCARELSGYLAPGTRHPSSIIHHPTRPASRRALDVPSNHAKDSDSPTASGSPSERAQRILPRAKSLLSCSALERTVRGHDGQRFFFPSVCSVVSVLAEAPHPPPVLAFVTYLSRIFAFKILTTSYIVLVSFSQEPTFDSPSLKEMVEMVAEARCVVWCYMPIVLVFGGGGGG